MGITINGIHSDTYDVAVRTISMPLVAEKKTKTTSVPGVNGDYVTESGYKNKFMELEFEVHDETLYGRMRKTRMLVAWIIARGKLSHDAEPHRQYTIVKSTNNINDKFNYESRTVKFTAIFELDPILEDSFDTEDVIWSEAHISWQDANFPWTGQPKTFDVSNGSEINVTNLGNYPSYPTIKLTGVADSISFGGITFTNLDGIVYIECNPKAEVAYELSGETKVNRYSDISGEFIALEPGDNNFTITGTITGTVELFFDHRNAYI